MRIPFLIGLSAILFLLESPSSFGIAFRKKDPSSPPARQWQSGHFENSAGARDYFVYIPSSAKSKTPLPLVLMLHGCTQNASGFAKDTGMNAVAERNAFLAVYPEQPAQANPMKCWQWFLPQNQKRASGELSILAGIVQKIQREWPVDADHIFVAGFSAGAAMAANLAACYSDLFSGAAIHSGLDYKSATNQNEAQIAMAQGSSLDLGMSGQEIAACTGKSARLLRVIALHGKSDSIVNPVNAEHTVMQFTKMNDFLDDLRENGSQNLRPIHTLAGEVPNGYRYSLQTFGAEPKENIAWVSIEKMGHAWSGSAQSGSYADPRGPSASALIWDFLYSAHPQNSLRRPGYTK